MAELTHVIQSRNDLPCAYNAMARLSIDGPHEVSIKPVKKTRTLNQNAVFHMWMNELSAFLIAAGRKFATPEWSKDAMKHSFLGYIETDRVDVVTGAVMTVRELQHTSRLNTGAMYHFMEQVEAWCASIGCLLTIPNNSEYMKLKMEQNQ
ncbi:recombination protein NinB [Tolumonas lignilytica]|uniref:recombination protein NinB n=1 Tax=Tolumonas lignilytica TaxID=1283284 RepID=UPI0004662D24|nr:recombination protein NinB [Tolumonas lignilytica]